MILVNEDSSTEEIHYNVSTQNSYAPLQNSEAADSTEERDILVKDVTIIADSHGRSLDAKRMYKNKNVEIKILNTRKKNLDGNNSVDTVIEKFRNVRDQFIEKFPSSKSNIVPVLPRLYNERYNREASAVNSRLQVLISDRTSIVNLDDITTADRTLFNKDDIHLSKQGNLVLVRMLKTQLNPKLGLPAYSSYSHKDKMLGFNPVQWRI